MSTQSMSEHFLHDNIQIIFSTVRDGSMAGGGAARQHENQHNQDRFLARHGFPLARTSASIVYDDTQTYRTIVRIDASNAGGRVAADALYTTEANTTLLLPVADCIATVVYDPVTNLTGLLHLGRHSSVAGLIEAFVIEAADMVGSDPRDWYVWMSPSLRQSHDRLDYFTPDNPDEWNNFMVTRDDGIYIDTVGHNTARFVRAGVPEERIVVALSNTYTDTAYFSHRAAMVSGDQSRQGRMIAAVRVTS